MLLHAAVMPPCLPHPQVIAKDMPGTLVAKVQQQQQQQQQATSSSRKAGGAAAATGGDGAAAAGGGVDAVQVVRTAKRELIRDALELAVTSAVNHPHIVQVSGWVCEDCTMRTWDMWNS